MIRKKCLMWILKKNIKKLKMSKEKKALKIVQNEKEGKKYVDNNEKKNEREMKRKKTMKKNNAMRNETSDSFTGIIKKKYAEGRETEERKEGKEKIRKYERR